MLRVAYRCLRDITNSATTISNCILFRNWLVEFSQGDHTSLYVKNTSPNVYDCYTCYSRQLYM